jgi:hypothetical protein
MSEGGNHCRLDQETHQQPVPMTVEGSLLLFCQSGKTGRLCNGCNRSTFASTWVQADNTPVCWCLQVPKLFRQPIWPTSSGLISTKYLAEIPNTCCLSRKPGAEFLLPNSRVSLMRRMKGSGKDRRMQASQRYVPITF